VEHRPITHREAARLMGFPDDFLFKGGKTDIAKQIGNAVPPDLAGAIAAMVKKCLNAFSAQPARVKRRLTEVALAASVAT
jgi:DNA (cytosine-5)-methyltransferase 1